VSIAPASMRRLNVDGVAWLRLTGCPGLAAPMYLVTRRRARSAIVQRFREAVKADAAAAGSHGP
jgi:hypothetical protein